MKSLICVFHMRLHNLPKVEGKLSKVRVMSDITNLRLVGGEVRRAGEGLFSFLEKNHLRAGRVSGSFSVR